MDSYHISDASISSLIRVQAARRIGHLPRFRGQQRIIESLVPWEQTTIYCVGIGQLPGDLHINIDTRSWLERDIFFTGGYQRQEVCLLQKFARADAVFVDIGANIGVFSLGVARCFRRVYSVEPQPHIFRRLLSNIELNHLDNVTPLQCAVGAAEGTVPFYYTDETHENHGLASLAPDVFSGQGRAFKQIDVPIARLDDLLSGDDRNVAVVKIDVEGFEYDVLRGMDAIIQHARPTILLEVWPEVLARSGTAPIQLWDWLRARGYSFVDANTGKPIIALDRFAGGDVLAVVAG